MSDNIDIEKACAFTGHREILDEIDLEALAATIKGFIKEGKNIFLCGMAMGFDLIAADVVLSLKKDFPGIRLIACVPCPFQQKNFPAEERKKYERILPLCDEVKRLSKTYFKGCMLARDRFMVDNSSVLIAYGRKNEGGTFYTLNYALSKRKRIYMI